MTSSEDLKGKRVAILVADGFEEVELKKPRQALDEAGAETVVVSPARRTVKAWKHTDWGEELPVDLPLAEARAEEFDTRPETPARRAELMLMGFPFFPSWPRAAVADRLD